MMSTTFTYTYEARCVHEQKAHALRVVGMVHGHGYGGQQKDTICDVRGLCQTIWNIFKPVCRWFRHLLHLQAAQVLRYGDFRGDDDGQTDYFTPAHARGIMMWHRQRKEVLFRRAQYHYSRTKHVQNFCGHTHFFEV